MRILWITASIALAGCTVGPNFQPPAAPAQTSYTAPGERQAVAIGDKATADWWTLFHYAPLDQLIRDTVAGNYNLESAKARLAASQETIKVTAKASPWWKPNARPVPCPTVYGAAAGRHGRQLVGHPTGRAMTLIRSRHRTHAAERNGQNSINVSRRVGLVYTVRVSPRRCSTGTSPSVIEAI